MATVVAFLAHPDDEVLTAAGTLAQAAAEGHRTVLVVATDGLMGARPASGEPPRLAELRASAAVLGVARVECLGYANGGGGQHLYPDPPDRVRFPRADTEEAAERLAVILRAENADVLLVHDASGGYGHRDHIAAHRVGVRAAELAGVPRLLAATMPRELVTGLGRAARLLRLPFGYDARTLRTAYTPRADITHAIPVRRWAARKRAALAAHRSQVTGTGRSARVFAALLRLPAPVFGLLFAREWFAEIPVPGRNPARR
ncbi:PIG-L family deacetylase [Goodfellowiella coeruleoviolacea]|uniref:N-acetylglucosaminyl deacetylase, LmbE family n=1 Tax=Goodfellowiella coeruleoviolacea TaxID=334858 RepID=A0AAE3GFG5_9PSEU|nr:PIG-L family deacetylase [Goodfellowiella coeruleoviolacea]MCP2167221.1 N-acetylglucosaminyl deacetylase, LmbE family [Goodfellowiella coeruleoviolacea]